MAVTKARSNAVAKAAKGDLSVGSGTNASSILAVGTDAQILVADSTASTGLKWATPATSTPTFVGASVYKSASQTLSAATFTALTFNTELFDTDSFHDNATNNTRMTIPTGKGGKYLVTSTTYYAANSTGIRHATVYKNGTAFLYNVIQGTVNDLTVVTSLVINLVAGDYIELFGYQNSGGSLVVYGGVDNSAFQISYLGA